MDDSNFILKRCPFCAEDVEPHQSVCPHCESKLPRSDMDVSEEHNDTNLAPNPASSYAPVDSNLIVSSKGQSRLSSSGVPWLHVALLTLSAVGSMLAQIDFSVAEVIKIFAFFIILIGVGCVIVWNGRRKISAILLLVAFYSFSISTSASDRLAPPTVRAQRERIANAQATNEKTSNSIPANKILTANSTVSAPRSLQAKGPAKSDKVYGQRDKKKSKSTPYKKFPCGPFQLGASLESVRETFRAKGYPALVEVDTRYPGILKKFSAPNIPTVIPNISWNPEFTFVAEGNTYYLEKIEGTILEKYDIAIPILKKRYGAGYYEGTAYKWAKSGSKIRLIDGLSGDSFLSFTDDRLIEISSQKMVDSLR